MEFSTFITEMENRGLNLTTTQIQQFISFYDLLVKWNERMNLTGITRFEDVVEKHFFDSLSIVGKLPFANKTLIDIGAGAGFPSIPLKIAYPDLEIVVLDSLGKRMSFINEVIKELKLTKIETVVTRAEDYARANLAKFDYVSARAVARLNILIEICIPLVQINGYFIAYKGMDGQKEIDECGKGITKLGASIKMIDEFMLPSEKSHRMNIFIQKIENTPSNYPRDFAKIKKQPLK